MVNKRRRFATASSWIDWESKLRLVNASVDVEGSESRAAGVPSHSDLSLVCFTARASSHISSGDKVNRRGCRIYVAVPGRKRVPGSLTFEKRSPSKTRFRASCHITVYQLDESKPAPFS